jgi:hypothetical protein
MQFQIFQDRLTAGCGALNAAMQVRILLLDPAFMWR